MSKLPLAAFLLLLFLKNSIAQKDETDISSNDKSNENQSTEQLRELEIDELIRSLEQRINAKDAYQVVQINEEKGTEERKCERENVFQVNPNPRDRKSLYDKADDQDDAKVDGEDREKRKITDKDAGLDEVLLFYSRVNQVAFIGILKIEEKN